MPCLLLKEDISQLWELDTIGIKPVKEDLVLTAFYNSIIYNENCYCTLWPWKDFLPNLPTNFEISLGQLKLPQKRLGKSLLQQYNAIIQEQWQQGITEKTTALHHRVSIWHQEQNM